MNQRHSVILSVVLLFSGVGTGFHVVAEERMDILQMVASRAVSITHSPLDLGSIANAVDGNAQTLARTATENPMVVTLEFERPQTFSSFRTRFLAGQNRWQMEGADTLEDMNARSGSHRWLVPWQTGPEQAWSSNELSVPHTCQVLRFSLQRLTGDNHVHLTDVEFFQPEETIALRWLPDPKGVSWNTRKDQWYALESTLDFAAWPRVEFFKAGSTSLVWRLPDPLLDEARFYRVRTALPEERSEVVKKVLVINYDPVLESEGGVRLHEHFGWNDPRALTAVYLADLSQASGQYVRWQVVDFLDLDEWPVKADGFQYNDHTYLEAWRTNGFHKPDLLDYARVVEDLDLDRRVREKEVDEVIMWGFPYAGFYESRMVGPTAYWCNAPPLIRPGTPLYIMMGLNYERGVAEALHSFGHRAESILTHVYGGWSGGEQINHLWDRFSRHERIAPGLAACGNVHFPPNALADYDYDNQTPVLSEAEDWRYYPELTGTRTWINAEVWGRSQRGYLRWWLGLMPKVSGRYTDGRLNNWWGYLVDLNEYRESR